MSRTNLITTAGIVVLMAGTAVYAAPGQNGSQRSAQSSRMEQPAKPQSKPKERTESKNREQKRVNEPEVGEREREQAEKAERVRDPAEGKGNETSTEMQARREERKQIQDEYRAAGADSETAKAKKKPWWKFWGSDDG
jgi:hypothetical protein